MGTSSSPCHATFGNRFSDFIDRVRIGQTWVQLCETADRLSSICFDVGYRKLAGCNGQFPSIKGMTPRAYRNEARRGLVR